MDGAYYLNNNGAGMFEIENTNYTVDEGETKEITIKRVGGSKGTATVHFSTSPDSAVHGRHYSDVNKIVEFADGQTTAIVSVGTIDNTEKAGDVKFYCNIDTPTDGAIIGFNKKAGITIIDNDIDKPYTQENPFILPTALDEKKLLEAELFTLNPISGNKYVRISESSQASNGKMVTWFEEGNKIRVPFYASKAGTYTFNMSYQSGRSEGNLNKVNWSGTNIESGSKSVPGTGNQNPVPIIKTSFDVVVTKAGIGELIFTADSKASPNIDVFEVTAKDLTEAKHTITAIAGENGVISPAGAITLEEGQSETFTFTPNEGYEVSDVIVDGVSVGAMDSYTVEDIKKNMTISVIFKLKDTDNNVSNSKENPIVLANEQVVIEAEKLELDGTGGEIENKEGANDGKVVGWLGNTSRGNAWLNMWVNSESAAVYDIEIRYFAGANNNLFYVSNDESISGKLECNKTEPNFETKTIRVSLNKGLDKIKFFNNEQSTVNIDSIRITRVSNIVDKSELNIVIENANKIDISKYTSNSLEHFNKALEVAKNVLSDKDATQVEVNEALIMINNTIENLIEKANKTELLNLLEEAKNIELDKYTSESVSSLKALIDKAEIIVKDDNVTQESVDRIKVELSNAVKVLVLIIDKSELNVVIENANKIDTSKYTPNSLEKFNQELEFAKNLVSNKESTQEDINNSINTLKNAIENLVVKANKKELLNLLEEVKAIDLDKYTSESVASLKVLIEKVEAVIKDENATQKSVDSLKSELLNSVKNLVEVNESNNNNNNNNSNNSNNDDNEDNNNNNSSNNNSQKLPNTGSPSGNLSGIIAVGLSTIGAILFRKKKTKF